MSFRLDESLLLALKRRAFLRRTGVGVGAAALQSLLLNDSSSVLASPSAAETRSR